MKKITPCDTPDENGEFHCPFADMMNSSGDFCRRYCGLGVDESEMPEDFEDEFTEEEI